MITITSISFIFTVFLLFALCYVNDSVGLTKKRYFSTTSMFWLYTIAQESHQSASRGRVLVFYRIAPCLNSEKEENLMRYTQIFETSLLEISVPFGFHPGIPGIFG